MKTILFIVAIAALTSGCASLSGSGSKNEAASVTARPKPVVTEEKPSGEATDWCVRSSKRYQCPTGMLSVIRKSGQISCRPVEMVPEEGEQFCRGVK